MAYNSTVCPLDNVTHLGFICDIYTNRLRLETVEKSGDKIVATFNYFARPGPKFEPWDLETKYWAKGICGGMGVVLPNNIDRSIYYFYHHALRWSVIKCPHAYNHFTPPLYKYAIVEKEAMFFSTSPDVRESIAEFAATTEYMPPFFMRSSTAGGCNQHPRSAFMSPIRLYNRPSYTSTSSEIPTAPIELGLNATAPSSTMPTEAIVSSNSPSVRPPPSYRRNVNMSLPTFQQFQNESLPRFPASTGQFTIPSSTNSVQVTSEQLAKLSTPITHYSMAPTSNVQPMNIGNDGTTLGRNISAIADRLWENISRCSAPTPAPNLSISATANSPRFPLLTDLLTRSNRGVSDDSAIPDSYPEVEEAMNIVNN